MLRDTLFMSSILRMKWWKENDYTSLNVDLESSSDEEYDDEEEGKDMHYVVGDVTQPQFAGTHDALILHCIGEGTHRH